MFETKKDYNETEMRTLIELLYGSIAIKEQALSGKNFLWVVSSHYWYLPDFWCRSNNTFSIREDKDFSNVFLSL